MTLGALLLCALLILSPGDRKAAVLIFLAGSGLGYFLELWGTTRGCWIYYTRETPPLFAVLAHGMAAMAFWRAGELAGRFYVLFRKRLGIFPRPVAEANPQFGRFPGEKEGVFEQASGR
jgi:hypothetical protein